jgi:predicted nuclease of predicted toxin-antitoxin system
MIRLYLDEDVHKQVALALRLRGYEVVSVHELEKWNLSDEEQLSYATGDNRAIFTFNRGDFAKLHENWLFPAKVTTALSQVSN